jgi:creatinine amidohydrolase
MLFDYQNTSWELKAAQPEIALLPVGATEPHADHLPIGAVNIVLDALARRVGESLSETVYLLPTMPLGSSGQHLPQAGTIALEWRTLMDVLTDLVESLLAQGIHKVVVIDSIGGAAESRVRPRQNYIVKTAVRQLNYDHPGLDAIWVQPFTAAGRDLEAILESATEDLHAGELVTSLLMHLAPALVKTPGADWVPRVERDYLDYVPFRQLCPHGVWGRPGLASAEKGRRALEAAVQRTVEYIQSSFSHLAAIKRRPV